MTEQTLQTCPWCDAREERRLGASVRFTCDSFVDFWEGGSKSQSKHCRVDQLEKLLRDIAAECESAFVDVEDMSPEWRELHRRIKAATTNQLREMPKGAR